ncbi:MAG: hypothetical protein JSW58_12150 [Candidatus Latescibacterota bacterium]|nr:MAG: hypothetical protein JSW58_12150 [Candidatus Latescibacterota bacterium]
MVKRRIMTAKRTLGMAIFAAVAFGCGTARMYSGPGLPRDDVAVIKGSRTVAGIRIYFSAKDDEGNEQVVYKIEVPAGNRKIRIFFGTTDGEVTGLGRTLSFRAEGGHTYQVKGIEEDGRVWIWIEDTYTHAIVGGEKP